MHDHRCQRQPLGASLWTDFHDLVETLEKPFEMVGDKLSVLAGQMVHPFVDGAERAGAALLVEVAAKALRPARGASAYELRQLSLFRLELSRHAPDSLSDPLRRRVCDRRRVTIVAQPRALTRAPPGAYHASSGPFFGFQF